MEAKSLKVAAFQFSGSGNIENNLRSLERGIKAATQEKVRFLLTQECVLCGYPPVETESIKALDFNLIHAGMLKVKQLALETNMYIALGTIHSIEGRYFNSVELISPKAEKLPFYGKRALGGWDADNFAPGNDMGIYWIDGFKVGIRICYEIRFPEYFRELFSQEVELAAVSFCDVGNETQGPKYEMIQSHLITRAVENAMFVMSANSISNHQLAPTCLINPDGRILQAAPKNEEHLFSFVIEKGQKIPWCREHRMKHSKELLK